MEEREKLREKGEHEVCISENLVRNLLIDVALLILQASLEADGNKDVLSRLTNNFSNGFEKVLQNKNEKKQMEERQEVREVDCQRLKAAHRSSLPSLAAKVKVHEETVVEDEENEVNEKVLSFLKEATARVALVLKDANSAFICFHDVVQGQRKETVTSGSPSCANAK